jgi:hypothetical protein
MTGERDRYRTATAAAVLLVAAIAAVVSYLHIAHLALAYGQEPLAAYLLPLSIDGVVATSSLVMLRAARAGVSSPWLARTGLVVSVVATLAANVASGLPHGWHGALLAGWPAVGFVLSAETAISMSRKRSPRGRDRTPDTDTSPATKRPVKRTPARTTKRTPDADTESVIISALAADPDMTTGQLATVAGVSERTVRRVRARLNGAATAT